MGKWHTSFSAIVNCVYDMRTTMKWGQEILMVNIERGKKERGKVREGGRERVSKFLCDFENDVCYMRAKMTDKSNSSQPTKQQTHI